MKTFGYTLRNKEGTLKKGALQAVDRIDALRQIKDMGCIPVSVVEGNGFVSDARLSWLPARWNRAAWGAAAGVVLIIALSVWLIANKKPVQHPAPVAAEAKKPPAALAGMAPKIADDLVGETPLPQNDMAKAPSEAVQQTALPKPAGRVRIFPRPVRAPENGVAQEPPAKIPQPFKTATEQVLSMAMSVPPGAMIPPLPAVLNADQDFVNSLTNVIVITDDDDAHSAEVKENVANAKNQLLELVNRDQSVADVLNEYRDTVNAKVEARREAQRELADLAKNGTPEEAKAYLDKVNKAFAELGVEPIALPRQRAR